jgi:hypothetical protein
MYTNYKNIYFKLYLKIRKIIKKYVKCKYISRVKYINLKKYNRQFTFAAKIRKAFFKYIYSIYVYVTSYMTNCLRASSDLRVSSDLQASQKLLFWVGTWNETFTHYFIKEAPLNVITLVPRKTENITKETLCWLIVKWKN